MGPVKMDSSTSLFPGQWLNPDTSDCTTSLILINAVNRYHCKECRLMGKLISFKSMGGGCVHICTHPSIQGCFKFESSILVYWEFRQIYFTNHGLRLDLLFGQVLHAPNPLVFMMENLSTFRIVAVRVVLRWRWLSVFNPYLCHIFIYVKLI